jgi:hypothetical protein
MNINMLLWWSLGRGNTVVPSRWQATQLHQIRDETDPQGRRRGPQVPHGTMARWTDCTRCRQAQNAAARDDSVARRKTGSRPMYGSSSSTPSIARRPQARHQRRVLARLCLQGVSGQDTGQCDRHNEPQLCATMARERYETAGGVVRHVCR